jgi:hypothetical protein
MGKMARPRSESGLILVTAFAVISTFAAALPTRERQLYPFDPGTDAALLAVDQPASDEFANVPYYPLIRTVNESGKLADSLIRPRQRQSSKLPSARGPLDPENAALVEPPATPVDEAPTFAMVDPAPTDASGPPPPDPLDVNPTGDLPGIPGLALIGFAVPEPSTWAMMIGGMMLVSGELRRKRRGTRTGLARQA